MVHGKLVIGGTLMIFDLLTATAGPLFSGVAIWRRCLTAQPPEPEPRLQRLIDWSLGSFITATVVAWVPNLAYAFNRTLGYLTLQNVEEASYLAQAIALVSSLVLAICGQGRARAVLLVGLVALAVGTFAGFLYLFAERNFTLSF
jgi:hypothetical protein